jgi:hypothetical protein
MRVNVNSVKFAYSLNFQQPQGSYRAIAIGPGFILLQSINDVQSACPWGNSDSASEFART